MIGSFNFGNIRTNPANAWQGKTTAPGAAFESFDTPENGVRAIAKVLQTYAGQGANTLESILARYSPPTENRTPSLIQAASQRTGYKPDQRLDLSDPAVLDTVTRAIITQEVGNAGPGGDVVQRGVKAALPSAVPTRNVSMLPTPQAAQENGGMGDFSFGSARSPRRSLTGLLEVADDNNFYDGLGGLLGQGQTESQPPGPSLGPSFARPNAQPPLNVNSRMDELMQGLLAPQTRGPSMTPGQYQLAGAGSAVGQLAGVHDRKVGFGEILGALGGGLTRGQLAGEQAQRDDRASQFQELGNIGKVQQYQRAEATNAAKIQAAQQLAAQLRATNDPQKIALAAAVERDPSLMDTIVGKQAESAFPKDQFYTLAPGAQRRDANNNIIADNPRAPLAPQRVQNVTTNDGIFVQNPDGSLGPRVGDRPQPRPQPQSWSEKEAILESDKAVEAGSASVSALERALTLNDKALSGATAGARAWIDRNLYPGDFGGEATTEFTNLVQGQALQSMKAIFGANPTEGERKALLDLNASVDKNPEERKVILNNAIAMAKARIARETDRGKAMRGGTYFSQGLPQPGGDQPGGDQTGGGMPAGNYVYNPETGELEPQQ